MGKVITRDEMVEFVKRSLDGLDTEYDVHAIADRLHNRYGLVDLDTVDPDFYWESVRQNSL